MTGIKAPGGENIIYRRMAETSRLHRLADLWKQCVDTSHTDDNDDTMLGFTSRSPSGRLPSQELTEGFQDTFPHGSGFAQRPAGGIENRGKFQYNDRCHQVQAIIPRRGPWKRGCHGLGCFFLEDQKDADLAKSEGERVTASE